MQYTIAESLEKCNNNMFTKQKQAKKFFLLPKIPAFFLIHATYVSIVYKCTRTVILLPRT